jgi:WD40 repeat protein
MIQIFPMAFGFFHDPALANLDVEPEVGRVVDLFSPFDAELLPWGTPAPMRGADATQERLRAWVAAKSMGQREADREPGASDSVADMQTGAVLYWVGHGWSDGRRHALAHARSPAVVGSAGVLPEQLAHAIAAHQARVANGDEDSGWVIVIIDTCKSSQIVDALAQSLIDFRSPSRVLVVGVSPDGATSLGRFNDALRIVFLDTFRTEHKIYLSDFATQLERVLGQGTVYSRGLGYASLVRSRPPVVGSVFAPMDTVRHLEEVLNSLSADERWHFLSKARGAEQGELAWFFQGRRQEMDTLSDWLENAESGLFVVTGPAGSGKSALLGNLFTHSVPDLRDALIRRGLLAGNTGMRVPPSNVFDTVIHLSGLDLKQIVSRIARGLGLGNVPAIDDPLVGVAGDVDWLVSALHEAAATDRKFTVLVDALDEAVAPLDTARALLVRLAAIPGVRVITGTRPSVRESPDSPTADDDLLRSLTPEGSDPDVTRVLYLPSDQEAILRYVDARLRHARDHGEDQAAAERLAQLGDEGIMAAARAVAERNMGFLFARLAVYEIVEDPSIIGPGRRLAFQRLLAGDHQDLFGQAIERLGRIDDRYPFLLQALSLARGRGLPEANGVWAVVAEALIAVATANVFPVTSGGEWSTVIHEVLSHAAPYVGADNLHSADADGERSRQPGTVYRLAHREFVEYFAQGRGPLPLEPAAAAGADALLGLAAEMGQSQRDLGHYLIKHLSGHVAETNRWLDLAAATAVLDALDPESVAADAVRSLFGRADMPVEIAGVVGARYQLMNSSPGDRRGIRQLASTVYGRAHVVADHAIDGRTTWRVAAARIGEEPLHVRLTGHTTSVNKVAALSMPDGRTVIASASDDGTVRLWDPLTLTPAGGPLQGHRGMVEDVTFFTSASGEPRLATCGSDGTIRIWDPVSGHQVLPAFEGHEGPVWEVAVVREPAGPGVAPPPRLASASADGTVRVWDAESGAQIGPPYRGHGGIAWTLASVLLPSEPALPETSWILSAGIDGWIHKWNPLTGESSQMLVTEGGIVRALGSLRVTSGEFGRDHDLVAAGGSDGVIRIWDPMTEEQVGRLPGHVGAVRHLANLPPPADFDPSVGPALSGLIVSTGSDGTVRAWDVGRMAAVGPPLTGHTGTVFGACGFTIAVRPDGDRTLWIASAGGDATVRVWHVLPDDTSGGKSLEMDDPIYSLAVVHRELAGKPAPSVVTGGASGAVTVWDPGCGRVLAELRGAMVGPVHAICPLPREAGSPASFAAGTEDGAIHFWTLDGDHQRTIAAAHSAQVYGLTIVHGTSEAEPAHESCLLVSAGGDGLVKVWNLGQPEREPLVIDAHRGPALSVAAVPGLGGAFVASGGQDRLVRLWNAVDGSSAMPPGRGHTGTVRVSAIPAPASSPGESPVTWLVSCCSDRTVRLWDPRSGEQVSAPLLGHTGTIFASDWFVDPLRGNTLVTVGGGGLLLLWDLSRLDEEPRGITAHVGEIHAVRPLASGTSGVGTPLLVTAGDDSVVRILDPSRLQPVGDPLSPWAVVSLQADGEGGTARMEYVLRASGNVSTWTSDDARLSACPLLVDVSHLAALDSDVSRQAPESGSRDPALLTVSTNGVATFHGHDGAILTSRKVADRGPTSILCRPGPPARLFFGLATGELGMWNPGGDHVLVQAHTGAVRSLTWFAEHRPSGVLVSAGDDGRLIMWDPTTLTRLSDAFQAHSHTIWSTAVTNRSRRLLTAGSDGFVGVWSLDDDTFTQVAILIGHSREVHALAPFSLLDGRDAVLTGSHDGTLKEWDVTSGKCHQTISLGMPVHALGPVSSPAMGPSWRSVTVGTDRGVVSVTFAVGDRLEGGTINSYPAT